MYLYYHVRYGEKNFASSRFMRKQEHSHTANKKKLCWMGVSSLIVWKSPWMFLPQMLNPDFVPDPASEKRTDPDRQQKVLDSPRTNTEFILKSVSPLISFNKKHVSNSTSGKILLLNAWVQSRKVWIQVNMHYQRTEKTQIDRIQIRFRERIRGNPSKKKNHTVKKG